MWFFSSRRKLQTQWWILSITSYACICSLWWVGQQYSFIPEFNQHSRLLGFFSACQAAYSHNSLSRIHSHTKFPAFFNVSLHFNGKCSFNFKVIALEIKGLLNPIGHPRLCGSLLFMKALLCPKPISNPTTAQGLWIV